VLILTRKPGESILIGDDIWVTVLDVDGERVKLGIEAPRTVAVLRQELLEQVKESNLAAVTDSERAAEVAAIVGSAIIRGRDASGTPHP